MIYIFKMYNIIIRIKWRFKIWNLFMYFVIILSIYKSCDWINFFHEMVFEIVLNNGIQIFFFSNWFIFLREKNMLCTLLEKN